MSKLFFLFPTRKKISLKPRFGGGSEAYLYDLSTGLAERGFEVHIVANFMDKSQNYINCHQVDFSKNILSRNWKYFKVLYRLLDRESIVIIFDQGFGGYIPVFFKYVRRFKLLFHTNNHYPWLETEINPRMYWPLIKTVARNADLVVVGNKLLAENVIKKSNLDPSKIRIIPQLMRDDDPLREKYIDVRRKYRIYNSPLVLFVGRIVPHKGISDIINAAKIVSTQIPNVKFFLVGPRSDEFSIKGENQLSKFYFEMLELRDKLGLEKHLFFTGVVPREEVYSFLRTADVFIFPSYKEGFGTAVLEAMSFGKPIVAYDIPPINENLSNAGILVDRGLFEKLAEAVITLINDPSRARTLCRAALKRFKSNFSLKAVIDKWIKLFEELQRED